MEKVVDAMISSWIYIGSMLLAIAGGVAMMITTGDYSIWYSPILCSIGAIIGYLTRRHRKKTQS